MMKGRAWPALLGLWGCDASPSRDDCEGENPLAAVQCVGEGALAARPLPNLPADDLGLLRAGIFDFVEIEAVEEGLGPAFNATSCSGCHNQPRLGGGGPTLVTRMGRVTSDGTFEILNGSSLLPQSSIPDHRCQPQAPVDANVFARRQTPPLFGLGLLEAIPDAVLLAAEDPDDANGDGISGRAARVRDAETGAERVGRLGWKAQHASLRVFTAEAYRNELGITNELFPEEHLPGVSAEAAEACDLVADPEDVRDPAGRTGVDRLTAVARFLAPLEPRDVRDDAVFRTIGCADCHTPSLNTGPSDHPAFDRVEVWAYTDLLLHDVGTGDGITQEDATGAEFRTPPLWGLGQRRPYLHDGRAADLVAAIRAHGGEATASVAAFDTLTATDQQALLAFLESL